MIIDKDTYLAIAKTTPFVSVDLIVRNEKAQVLLGYRTNRPAQDFWFVPGGRIHPRENIQDAIERIARNELGITARPGQLLGVFNHFYDDNFHGIPDVGTHYVVCAYQLQVESSLVLTADEQHALLKWWDLDELLASEEVHPNSKLCFQAIPEAGLRCSGNCPV